MPAPARDKARPKASRCHGRSWPLLQVVAVAGTGLCCQHRARHWYKAACWGRPVHLRHLRSKPARHPGINKRGGLWPWRRRSSGTQWGTTRWLQWRRSLTVGSATITREPTSSLPVSMTRTGTDSSLFPSRTPWACDASRLLIFLSPSHASSLFTLRPTTEHNNFVKPRLVESANFQRQHMPGATNDLRHARGNRRRRGRRS